MNPGAASRKGEAGLIKQVLNEFYDHIESIRSPGTAEGGDIMAVGSHFYIGLSGRTNQAGAEQLTDILAEFGLTSSIIPLKEVLHLKTAVTYLENGYLLAAGEFLKKEEFGRYRIIRIEPDERYAANSLWINGRVIMPAGYPQTKEAVNLAGYEVIEVEMSEFRKLDGGVSCLSLRF
jgi:dimethylargininase